MDVGTGLSSIYNATIRTASTVYGYVGGFSKAALEKCSGVAGRVGEIAKRFIPSFISNTVTAHPRAFAALGAVAAISTVAIVASRLLGNTPPRGDQDMTGSG